MRQPFPPKYHSVQARLAWTFIIFGAIFLAAASMMGCESMPRYQEIGVSDSRITKIIIAEPNLVQKNCPGDLDDHGNYRGDSIVGGCYHPPYGPIWISYSQDIKQILDHEVCHAISGLPDYECDNMYPGVYYERGYIPPHRE